MMSDPHSVYHTYSHLLQADNSLSVNGNCAITKLRTFVQQDWGTMGPAEDAVSVLDWNVFIFLGLSRPHAGGRRRQLI